MPKIYEYFGLIFLFYSNDHLPVHVHVKSGDEINKYVLEYENGKLVNVIKIRTRRPLNEKKHNESVRFKKNTINRSLRNGMNFLFYIYLPSVEKLLGE